MNRSLSLALSMSRRLVTFSLFAMWLFVAGVVIWIGPSVLLGTKFGLPMLSISVSILMMATVLDRISTNTARRLNTYQQNEGLAFADAMYFFENAIIDQKRPLVRIESSIEKIAKAAAELVRDAVAALPIGEFQVVFFGAVGFQIAPDDWRRETGVDETLSPHQVYHGALEEIASKSIPVGRFVSLLTDKEFDARSPAVRRRYIAWLDSQKSQMKRNPNFVIIDSPRAPKWGTAGGSILSSKRMVQFTHTNGCAIILDDNQLTGFMVHSNIDEITSAKPKNIHVYRRAKFEIGEDAKIEQDAKFE